MKPIAVVLAIATLMPALASADSAKGASDLSLEATASVVVVSALLILLPFATVSEVKKAVSGSAAKVQQVDVTVTNEKGARENVAVPADAAARAQLKAGDRLTIRKTAAGALLSKGDTPLVYMVTKEDARLSGSHELVR
jgi:hypothetical protein